MVLAQLICAITIGGIQGIELLMSAGLGAVACTMASSIGIWPMLQAIRTRTAALGFLKYKNCSRGLPKGVFPLVLIQRDLRCV